MFCYSSSASFQIIKIVELFCKHASPLNNNLPFFSQKCIIKKFLYKKTATPDFSRIAEYNLKYKILNYKLLDNCSNTTVNITNCIVLNISSDISFHKIVHFVIIISISKVFQVQNKPMGFLPPIKTKGLITMKLIHAEYNPMHNSIDINHYNGYILRLDCNQAESGIRTTPNSQRCLNALAIDNPLEYARLALDGEMQAWVDAKDSTEVF